MKLYLSFYQFIPDEHIEGDEFTRDHYTYYTRLNCVYGGGNRDYYMSAFLLIPWSGIAWAAQTSRILLVSVGAILACAIFVLPALFYWDAKRNPAAYGAPQRGGATATSGATSEAAVHAK